jgi:hypothetical protein
MILIPAVHHRTLIGRVKLHRRFAAISPTFRAADSPHSVFVKPHFTALLHCVRQIDRCFNDT